MRTSQTPQTQHPRADAWEGRRQRAWELHEQGWWQKDIAAALGVSRAAICQWLKRRRKGGAEALRTRLRPCGPAKLTAEQRAQVPVLLARGVEAYGFRGEMWTANRIAQVLWRTFGVRSHRDHVSRLVRQAGWIRQQPIERATQRNEQAIQTWYAARWPALKKKASDEGYTIVWGDESGLYLLPLAVRTWAPRGQTPVRHVKLTHDHLSAISGSTLDGRLFLPVREDADDTQGVVGVLRGLLRQIRGQIRIMWDGSPIHKGQPLKNWLTAGAAKRVHLDRLPGYAPDLNPDEGIWNSLKRVELKNRCCRDLGELRVELRRATERLRHQRDVIRGCSAQCGYSV